MKKIIFLMFIVLFVPFNVNALHDILDPNCTVSLKTSLKEEANNLVYRFGRNEENGIVTFTLYFYNLSNNLRLSDSEGNIFNDEITGLKPGTKATINISTSNNNACFGYKILTKIINVPYYNPYFGSEMCTGYEDYYLCKENINVSLTKDEFIDKLNEYKDGLKEGVKEEVEDKFEEMKKLNFFDYLYKYWIYIIIFVMVIGIFVIVNIIKKKNKERGIL